MVSAGRGEFDSLLMMAKKSRLYGQCWRFWKDVDTGEIELFYIGGLEPGRGAAETAGKMNMAMSITL